MFSSPPTFKPLYVGKKGGVFVAGRGIVSGDRTACFECGGERLDSLWGCESFLPAVFDPRNGDDFLSVFGGHVVHKSALE